MPTISSSAGLATLINFLVGGAAGAADAANGARQALAGGPPSQRILSGVSASTDLVGIGASAGQMLSQFAANSTEAGALLGRLASRSGQVGLLVNIGSVVSSVREQGPGKITSGQLDALAGAALAVGATVAAPEAAIVLGVLAAGMTVLSLADQSPSHTVANALNQLRGIIEPYVDKLPEDAKDRLAASLAHAMHAMFSDGASQRAESAEKTAHVHDAASQHDVQVWLQRVDELRNASVTHLTSTDQVCRGGGPSESAVTLDEPAYAYASKPDVASSIQASSARPRFK